METSQFLLYYAILMQIVLCTYIFNYKMSWAIMVSSVYILIIYGFGLMSEISKSSDDNFGKILSVMANFILPPYLQSYSIYLAALPLLMMIVSIKLIGYEESDEESTKQTDDKSNSSKIFTVKLLFCMNVFLYAMVTVFGFPTKYVEMSPRIALYSILSAFVLSLIQLALSVIVVIN